MIALILEIINVSAMVCPIFECNSGNTVSECISYSNTIGLDVYSITPCEFTFSCSLLQHKSSDCFSSLPRSRYAGEACENSNECESYYFCNASCTNNVCSSCDKCNTSADCGSAFYCNSTDCVLLKNQGDPCILDEECPYGTVCDLGKCTLYFSKKNGVITSNILPVGLAQACISGFATLSGGRYLCATAPVSNTTDEPISCNPGSLCYARDGINFKPCMCGYDGNGYCPLFEGDEIVQEYIVENLSEIVAKLRCNSLRRYSYYCAYTQKYQEYATWATWALLYLEGYWVLKINNSDCINQTLTIDYWNIYMQDISLQKGNNIFSECTTTKMVENIPGWNSSQCFESLTDIYNSDYGSYNLFETCNNNSYCDLNSCVSKIQRYPGEYCDNNYKCISNSNCINNTCIGKGENETCNYGECGIGLYCASVCIKALQEGEYCNKSYKCDTYLICYKNQCIKMYSLADGIDTGLCQGLQYTCQNPFCYSGMATIRKYCTSNINFTETNTVPCANSYQNCSIGHLCECGYDGNYYCPRTTTDIHYKYSVEYFQSLMTTNRKCNVDIGYTEGCYGYNDTVLATFYYYYTNLTYLNHIPSILSNDLNINYLYIPQFYDALEAMKTLPDPIPWPNNPPRPFEICPDYYSPTGSSSINRCIAYNTNYYIYPCQFTLSCQFSPKSNSYCVSPLERSRYAGEACSNSYECESYYSCNAECSAVNPSENNNYCFGCSKCNTSKDCDPGSYCNNSTDCVPLKNQNDSCISDEECSYDSICDIGICTPYFSKINGDITSNILPVGLAQACSTGFATLSKGNYICTTAPVSNTTDSPIPCEDSSLCYAKDRINYKYCMCGYDGNGYCPLFEGDEIVQEYIVKNLSRIVTDLKCNTLRRFSYYCAAGKKSYEYATWAANALLYLENYWVLRINNPLYIIGTFTADYWNIYNQSLFNQQGWEYFGNDLLSDYEIAENLPDWESGICEKSSIDIYNSQYAYYATLRSCNQGYECKNNSCVKIPSSYAGEFCYFNETCSSLNCTNRTCAGKTKDEICTFGECEIGLFCNINNICSPASQIDEVCGDALHVCDTYLICYRNQCIEMYSIDDNTTISINCDENSYCQNPICFSGISFGSICTSDFNFSNTNTAPCQNSQQKCSQNYESNSSCKAGINKYYFCGLNVLDEHYGYSVDYFTRLMSTKIKCNVDAGYTFTCYSTNITVLSTFYYFYTNLTFLQASRDQHHHFYFLLSCYLFFL